MKYRLIFIVLLVSAVLAAQQARPQAAQPQPQTAHPAASGQTGKPPASPRTLTVQRDASGALSIDPQSFVQFMLPSDSPLEVVKVDYGSSQVTQKQSGLELNLDLTVTVRNRSDKPVEGVALAMGGMTNAMGLNAISGIRLESGAVFTLPAMRAKWEPNRGGAMVQTASAVKVSLDAVLFSDGSGYGPDVMRALSAMRMNQAESIRDRHFFGAMYQSGGLTRVLPALERWANEAANPGSAPEVRAIGGQTAEQVRRQARIFSFRAQQFPGAPVEIISARAGIVDGRLVDPVIQVRNVSGRDITDLHVTWIVRDAAGKEFRAATLSESGRPQPGYRFELSTEGAVTLAYPSVLELGSGPVLASRVFVRAVQFSDGRVWVPDRSTLVTAGFPSVLTLSPEVIRLYRIYQTRGSRDLISEIRR